MYPYFNDFMFQRYTVQLYSDMSVIVYTKNSIFFVLAYGILNEGRGMQAERSYRSRQACKNLTRSRLPPFMYNWNICALKVPAIET
jgi:hypothetical protein